MSRSNNNLRRGVSLTELLILSSATTIILTMSAMLLHSVMRVQVDSRAFADAERNAARLSHQFRQDAHHATAATVEAAKLKPNVLVELQLPLNETIEYSRANGSVLRTLSKSGKTVAREEFAFQSTSKISANASNTPNTIVLSVTAPSLDAKSSKEEQLRSYRAAPISLQIEAGINRTGFPSNPVEIPKTKK